MLIIAGINPKSIIPAKPPLHPPPDEFPFIGLGSGSSSSSGSGSGSGFGSGVTYLQMLSKDVGPVKPSPLVIANCVSSVKVYPSFGEKATSTRYYFSFKTILDGNTGAPTFSWIVKENTSYCSGCSHTSSTSEIFLPTTKLFNVTLATEISVFASANDGITHNTHNKRNTLKYRINRFIYTPLLFILVLIQRAMDSFKLHSNVRMLLFFLQV